MSLFRYDFGYGWPWTWGHMLVALVFGLIALAAWRTRLPRWVVALSSLVAAWAVAGAVIVNVVFAFSLPLPLPTRSFLAGKTGRVLDLGAGSGRATLMVLLEHTQTTVVALDIFSNRFGIDDNTPERLRANARAAHVENRLEVQTGDVRDMPFADASFEGAVSAFVIDHLNREGIATSLAETRRVLKPGGEFLLLVLNPDLWVRVTFPMLAEHGYFGQSPRPDYWQEQLGAAGFDIVEVGTTPGTLYLLGRTPSPAIPR